MNTLVKERADQLLTSTDYQHAGSSMVDVCRLDEILERYLPEGLQIDLMSVDTEGMDLDVLASNDWERFRPRAIVAEDLESTLLDVSRSKVVVMLREHGYFPIAKTGRSLIFTASREYGRAQGTLDVDQAAAETRSTR